MVISAGLALREDDGADSDDSDDDYSRGVNRTMKYEQFLHAQLRRHASWPWKVCVWHRTGEGMQARAYI